MTKYPSVLVILNTGAKVITWLRLDGCLGLILCKAMHEKFDIPLKKRVFRSPQTKVTFVAMQMLAIAIFLSLVFHIQNISMFSFFKSLFKNDTYESLNAQSFLAKVKATPDAIILDVRTPAEVAAGMLPNAVNIDFQGSNFTAQVAKLDKNKTYFVYCRSGVRSANACRKMHEMGFDKLINLSGGYLSV